MKSHLRLQKKILAFGLDAKAVQQLEQLLRFEKVTVRPVTRASEALTLRQLVDRTEEAPGAPFEETLLLFADFTKADLNAVLNRLMQEKVTVDYRAVLTPTNGEWTPHRLFAALREEKQALETLRKTKKESQA